MLILGKCLFFMSRVITHWWCENDNLFLDSTILLSPSAVSCNKADGGAILRTFLCGPEHKILSTSETRIIQYVLWSTQKSPNLLLCSSRICCDETAFCLKAARILTRHPRSIHRAGSQLKSKYRISGYFCDAIERCSQQTVQCREEKPKHFACLCQRAFSFHKTKN